MTVTVSTAVAERDKPTPSTMVTNYRDDFALVLPSHLRAPTWVRIAQGALKKGKKDRATGLTELEIAASNNPGVFLASLLDAARLGLEPGTEQYYLTPRKVNGRLEILGIVGYQGYIELMYRAGAISTVVAECVYSNDQFIWSPGRVDTERPARWDGPMQRPLHEVDWDMEDRGALRLVYSYAVMKNGTTSKVVVLNRAAIKAIKASSQGANSEYSPWVKHEAAMWLKSAVRQLAKWVPTSPEFRLPAGATVEPPAHVIERESFAPALETAKHLGDDWIEADVEVHDGEIVEDDREQPGGERAQPMAAAAQLTKLHTVLGKCGVTDRTEGLTMLGEIAGRKLETTKDLTRAEAVRVIDVLDGCARAVEPRTALDEYLLDLDRAAEEATA